MKKLTILILFCIGGLVPNLHAQNTSTFFVTDNADLLTLAEEQKLEQKIKAYQTATANQIAIVTINRLPSGESLEQTSLKLANKWGIGQQGKNNGVLILVVKDDRKLRIEVGKGLTNKLTHTVAKTISRKYLRPNFKKQQFYKGLNEGLTGIQQAIAGKFNRMTITLYVLSGLTLLLLGAVSYFLLIAGNDNIMPVMILGCVLFVWMMFAGSTIFPGFLTLKLVIIIIPTLAIAGLIAFRQKRIRRKISRARGLLHKLKYGGLREIYLPEQLNSKHQELLKEYQQKFRFSTSGLSAFENKVNNMLENPEQFFELRMDGKLVQSQENIKQYPKHRHSKFVKFTSIVQETLNKEINHMAKLNTAKLSKPAQIRLNNMEAYFQTMETAMKLFLTDKTQTILAQAPASKHRQTVDARWTTFMANASAIVLAKLTQDTVEDINKKLDVLRELAEEKYPRVIVQIVAKWLGTDALSDETDMTQLLKALQGKETQLQKHKAYNKANNLQRQKINNAYKKVNETIAENLKECLEALYEVIVEVQGSSTSSSGYSSGSSSGSSSSSYSSGNSSSSSGSSSWGGGSFGGDGASDDW